MAELMPAPDWAPADSGVGVAVGSGVGVAVGGTWASRDWLPNSPNFREGSPALHSRISHRKVRSTGHVGPPHLTKSRTFTLTFVLDL